jgi:hypothetical protein
MRRLLWLLELLRAHPFLARRVFSSAGNNRVAPLSSLANEIDAVNESTEAEFLDIGSKLRRLDEASREISQRSASTSKLLAGEEVGAAMDGLRRISANMERVSSDSQLHSEHLRGLLRMVEDVTGALRGFQRYVQKLNLLCVTTRIEIAHVGSCEADFETLADDIEKLTQEIETKSKAILSKLESLAAFIRQSLSKIVNIEESRRGHTRAVLDHTSWSLSGLMGQYEKSLSTATRIADGYDELTRIMGEIVCSLQFHDITRQQIEHAAGSLRRLADPQERTEEEVGDLCELQAAQLRFAAVKLSEAVERIIDNLQSAAEKIVDITGEMLALSGDGEPVKGRTHTDGAVPGQGMSFLSKTEERLSYARDFLGGYAEKNRDLVSITQSISEALKDLSPFVGKIRQIGLAIRLIALNSIVKSSHVGDRGAALGVLANEIHDLSLDTGRQTQVISEAFETITASTLQINGGAAQVNGSKEEGTALEMIETLDSLMKTLSAANKTVSSDVAAVAGAAGNLVNEIKTAVSQIHVHERVSTAIEEISSKIDAAVVDMRGASLTTGQSASGTRKAELMKEIEQSYTMNSEREIHQLVSGSSSADARTDAPVSSAEAGLAPVACSDGLEFGDNVELF